MTSLFCYVFGHKVTHSGATDACLRCPASRSVRGGVGPWVTWSFNPLLGGYYIDTLSPVQRPRAR